nr:hypothetical protein [Tanacetum cinerariifolium]
MNETFHEQTDDEVTKKELKHVKADDQAIQTILLGLPEDIYAVVDSLFHQDQPSLSTYMQQPLPNNNHYNPQPSFNQNYIQQPLPNPKDITYPTTAMNMAPVNPNGNGNVLAAQTKGNATGNNGNKIRCYNCKGLADLDKIKEVNANCILMANLQQASTSGTQTNKAPVYDSDRPAKVHNYDNCHDNEIFNMFTQEEQYIELLKPIPEPHQVQQNDSNVLSKVSSVEQDGGTVDQHPATIEETRAYFESLYNNLTIKVEKFLKEAAKFVRDFKSLAKEADESLAKHKALKLEIECLLKEIASRDIMSVVQNNSAEDTSNL